MEDLTRISIEQVFWIIVIIIILVAIVSMLFVVFPKKRYCSDCGKKIRNKSGVCETCTIEYFLQQARSNSPKMMCHIHGEIMKTRIILGIEDVVLHTCPNPTCSIIAMDKKDLSKLTLLDLELYPPESEKKETS